MTDPDLQASIAAQNAKFMQAAEKGDAAALAALYTDEAWLLPPGAEMVRGRAAIEEFWASRFQRIAAIELTTTDLAAVSEDGAREVGASLITLRGQNQRLTGKYMVVWKLTEGEWKLEADMWNSNT
jgi:uncharacterized protein (TIGR02246 family)